MLLHTFADTSHMMVIVGTKIEISQVIDLVLRTCSVT